MSSLVTNIWNISIGKNGTFKRHKFKLPGQRDYIPPEMLPGAKWLRKQDGGPDSPFGWNAYSRVEYDELPRGTVKVTIVVTYKRGKEVETNWREEVLHGHIHDENGIWEDWR